MMQNCNNQMVGGGEDRLGESSVARWFDRTSGLHRAGSEAEPDVYQLRDLG